MIGFYFLDAMETEELNEVTDQFPLDMDEAAEAFHPMLTLASKKMHNRRRGANFHRVFIGMIDFAGDQSPELDGISVSLEGGMIVPQRDLPEGLTIEEDEDCYRVRGRASDENPYAVLDIFPDGKSQAGKLMIERDGCDPVEETFEFTPSGLHWLFDVTESLVWAFFIAMLIRIFLFQTFFIPSGSMQPTLFEGDRIVANKLLYNLRMPKRGEVVIFKVFSHTTAEELEQASTERLLTLGRSSFTKNLKFGDRFIMRDYIKRVAGLPGHGSRRPNTISAIHMVPSWFRRDTCSCLAIIITTARTATSWDSFRSKMWLVKRCSCSIRHNILN